MRILALAISSIVLGVVLGAVTTWARLGGLPETFATPAPVPATDPEGKAPQVIVDNETYDFGDVEHDSISRHAFRFQNVGDGVLTLSDQGTSCGKCTISSIGKNMLSPGESTDVTVEYHALGSEPRFRQEARIGTNDPSRPLIELTIEGNIKTSIRGEPMELVFSSISPSEPKIATMKVFAYLTEHLEVSHPELTDPETAGYFDVDIRPLERGKLGDPEAKSGALVTVRIKPGLPLGRIAQKLRLRTNVPGKSVVEIPIDGLVVSDISLAGKHWDDRRALLSLGTVNSREGGRRELLILVRGEHRHDVQFSLERCDPSFLQVHFGRPSPINHGLVIQVPLVIEVPAGSPAADRLGSEPGDWGTIWIKTTHPQVKQIRLSVRFAIKRDA